MKSPCQSFLCLLLLRTGCSVPPVPPAVQRPHVTPLLVAPSSITAPAPTVTHLAWSYTNKTCSADLQFEVEQSTNLINWERLGTSYCLSLSVTSSTAHVFYRVKTLVP
jgi:hypothetical protein